MKMSSERRTSGPAIEHFGHESTSAIVTVILKLPLIPL